MDKRGIVAAALLVIGLLGALVVFMVFNNPMFSSEGKSIEELRTQWIDIGNTIRTRLASQGVPPAYHCCIKDTCWYCIYKTPEHGEGGTCACRFDLVMKGEEICGECLGEWIEGEGVAMPMVIAAFQRVYPEIWEIIKDKY